MWHIIRFTIIWMSIVFTLQYYGVPWQGSAIILGLIWMYGINEIYDCYVRWVKWDK